MGAARRTYDRENRPELIKLEIETRVPEKWRFVDLETGDVWMWDGSRGPYKQARDIVVHDVDGDKIS